jgi:UDP-glucose 4-epimerase
MFQQHYKSQRVLVTGGAGFIGSHLVKKLVELGARVTILDDFSTGKAEQLTDIAHRLRIVIGSIEDENTCYQAAQGASHIFHLAAMSSVKESCINPDKCHSTNVLGTENIIKAAKKHQVKHLVFSSSAAVYGEQQGTLSESDTPSPISPYGVSKLEGEHLLEKAHTPGKLLTVSLRYFNVYSYNQESDGHSGAVVANFIHRLKNNQPLLIFGTGAQTRDFVHVDKIVEANLAAGTTSDPTHNTYNVGSGSSITLLELIKKLHAELKLTQEPKIQFLATRDGDITHSSADCSKYHHLQETISSLGTNKSHV